jgi:cation diffusion facilitator family transporter
MNERQAQIVKASWVSIIGNAILSVLKISIGLIAGSLAVVGDGIDSASDIITSIITLLTARILAKQPNKKFPFGYEKADTIATKALSFIIFFAGAQLAISTVSGLLEDTPKEMPSMLAIYITIFSIFGKLFLSYYQRRMGKKVESAMLLANSKNMQNDVIISLSVLVGLAFTFIFELPIIDTVTAFAVSIWIMYTAYRIFMQTNVELMDGIEDESIYGEIFKAVSCIKGVYNPHRVRIRKIGYRYMIDIDIEVEGSKTVSEAHAISHRVEEKIRKSINNVYDIVIHIEPYGDVDKDEKFGVSNRQINKKP